MFCSCDNNAFGAYPNSCICPVCSGHPGSLPVPNKKAIELGIKTALALGCEILSCAKFDRKNYFYPDLPYGFQISQFDEPISQKGNVEIYVNSQSKKIGITRLHLENDAGKLTHINKFSLVDLNRAGTPLMEIVTEPDLYSALEAKILAEEVQKIIQFIGSSYAEMSRGEMRFDASVSLREKGSAKLNPRAEIKNLNSFRSLFDAIEFEISRQKKLWEENQPLTNDSTRGWNDEKNQTYLLREKESAADYRYFPEPDIPPFEFSTEQIEKWRTELPELPAKRREKFMQDFKISAEDAITLTSSRELSNYFEKVCTISQDPKRATGWILSELLGKFNEISEPFDAKKISAENLGKLIKLIANGEISGKIGKEIFPEMWKKNLSPSVIIEQKGLKQISDQGVIEDLVQKVLVENPRQVEQFRAGKEQLLGFFVGQVMKLSQGQANPKIVNEVLRASLK
jgi:aspartyl-tRNA(Asn)/glutamyl-tRNA(Gln) amidotransferase subunit B